MSSPTRTVTGSVWWRGGRASSSSSSTGARTPTRAGPCSGSTGRRPTRSPRSSARLASRSGSPTSPRRCRGLSAGQTGVRAGSPYVDRPLGHTRARSRTGASIVAIVRGEDVIASPTPDEVLRAGDVLVVIGTRSGIAGVEKIIRG
ncbi:TrkA C-terminal domain-containing protein [Nonomuraea dietziae]|uniref:TrkA C-terminal domain-containing protein n=1 Tax=Nonomuraea dietziae TaxID=65515 RepID=UPI0031E0D519